MTDPRLLWVADRIRSTLHGVTNTSLRHLLADAEAAATLLSLFESDDAAVKPAAVVYICEKEYVPADGVHDDEDVDDGHVGTGGGGGGGKQDARAARRSRTSLAAAASRRSTAAGGAPRLHPRLHVTTEAVHNCNITGSAHHPAEHTRCLFFVRVDGTTITAEAAADWSSNARNVVHTAFELTSMPAPSLQIFHTLLRDVFQPMVRDMEGTHNSHGRRRSSSVASLTAAAAAAGGSGDDGQATTSVAVTPAKAAQPAAVAVSGGNVSNTRYLYNEILGWVSRLDTQLSGFSSQVSAERTLPMAPHLMSLGSTEADLRAALANDDVVRQVDLTVAQWQSEISYAMSLEPQKEGPLGEIEYWREKYSTISALHEQINSPEARFILQVAKAAECNSSVLITMTLQQFAHQYAEAKDNVKFLGTLDRHFRILHNLDPRAPNATLQPIIDSLSSMMTAIRMVWIISRFYSTEERMVSLLQKIARLIAQKVSAYIHFRGILALPIAEARRKVSEGQQCLLKWKSAYLNVQEEINNTEREKHWTFDNRRLFDTTDYMSDRCTDLLEVLDTVEYYTTVLSAQLKTVLTDTTGIDRILANVEKLKRPFETLTFDPFERKATHNWQVVFSGFVSTVASLDLEVAHFVNSIFDDDLRSAESAFELLLSFKKIQSRPERNSGGGSNSGSGSGGGSTFDISAMLREKADRILAQYFTEMENVQRIFVTQRDAPPLTKNQPPVAGSIHWCMSLFQRLKRPVVRFQRENMLTTAMGRQVRAKYVEVARQMKDYVTARFLQWRDEVHYTTATALKRNILRKSGPAITSQQQQDGKSAAATASAGQGQQQRRQRNVSGSITSNTATTTTTSAAAQSAAAAAAGGAGGGSGSAAAVDATYEVNFDYRIFDMIRETKYLDRLGFDVPQEALHITLQHETYHAHVDALKAMLLSYNYELAVLEGPERAILTRNIRELKRALEPGFHDINWTSLSIPDFVQNCDKAITKFRNLSREVRKSADSIQTQVVYRIASTKLMPEYKELLQAGGELPELQTLVEVVERRRVELLERCVRAYRTAKPLLTKVESQLAGTHTGKCAALASYYSHWEQRIWRALTRMVLTSLAAFAKLLGYSTGGSGGGGHAGGRASTTSSSSGAAGGGGSGSGGRPPLFKVAVFLATEPAYAPPQQEITAAFHKIQAGMVDSTRQFARWMRGTCIEYTHGELVPRPAEEDAATLFTFYQDIHNLPQVYRLQALIHRTIQTHLGALATNLKMLQRYRFVYLADKKISVEQQAKSQLHWIDYDAKFQLYFNMISDFDTEEHVHNFGFMRCDEGAFYAELVEHIYLWIAMEGAQLNDTVRTRLTRRLTRIRKANEELSRSCDDMEGLKAVLECTHAVRASSLEVEQDIAEMEYMYDTLQRFGVVVDAHERAQAASLRDVWACTLARVHRVSVALEPRKLQFRALTQKEVASFAHECERVAREFARDDGDGPGRVGVRDLAAGLEAKKRWRSRVAALQARRDTLTRAEKLFDLPLTSYVHLQLLNDDLVKVEAVYELYEQWCATVRRWNRSSWKDLSLDDLEHTTDERVRQARVMARQYGKVEPFAQVQQVIVDFQASLPLLAKLKSPALQPRHWHELMRLTGREFNHEQINLDDLIAMELFRYTEAIDGVVLAAAREAGVAREIDAIKSFWAAKEFTPVPYEPRKGDVRCDVLTDTSDIQEAVDDHMLKMQSIANVKWAQPFVDDVAAWERRLAMISDVLAVWVTVQQRWQYLESIFRGNADMAQQLPRETAKFADLDKKFVRIMHDTSATPNVSNACNVSGRLEELQYLAEKLEECQRELSNYLETKRMAFPRFYFISDDELLSMLASHSARAVQDHMLKMFDNCARLVFKSAVDETVCAVVSQEGERVDLATPVRTEGRPVEEWLQAVLDEVRTTLHDVCKAGVFYYPKMPRLAWLRRYLGMVTLTGAKIFWTYEIEHAFARAQGGDKDAVKALSTRLTGQLLDLVGEMARDDMDAQYRKKVNTLIIVDVHGRDIVDRFVRDSVLDAREFDWESQLRFYWERASDTCVVRQCTGAFDYGYEYMGLNGRLVITPLTDRCFMTLTQALTFHLGGAPGGPAGTGKTETVKDLAKALAVQCVVFNCGEGLDYKAMGSIFAGLAQAGSWGCFDEFNRIELPVLSVVSEQLRCIQAALHRNAREFVFADALIRLVPTVGVFITMNPGYAGRVELPDNLKALFRPVVMVVPDMELIAENMLFSEGFTTARTLAKKMVTLYALARGQLSKQHHYDWGLRALKAVLVMAGALKRGSPELSEESVLMRALRDMNAPKFIAEDEPLFRGLIGDLFPGLDPTRVPQEQLARAATQVLRGRNFMINARQIDKVVQLYETMQTRHTSMVVGPTGGGKTVVIDTLCKAQSELGLPTRAYVLNPKAQPTSLLYGVMDPMTRNWTDGIFSNIFRSINRTGDGAGGGGGGGGGGGDDVAGGVHRGNSATATTAAAAAERRYVVFDGDVDAKWVEDMNSVMDDNKLLTLPNGERIRLQPQCSLLFEVGDLQYASPATVSRVGMVFLDPVNLGWRPFFHAWRLSRPRDEQETLDELATTIVQPLLRFVLDGVDVSGELTPPPRLVIPSNELNMVKQLTMLVHTVTRARRGAALEPRTLQCVFLFACVWSIGALLRSDDDRARFDRVLKKLSGWPLQDVGENNVLTRFVGSGALPERKTMYDYVYDVREGRWRPWHVLIRPFVRSPGTPFSALLVSTVDTERNMWLLNKIVRNRSPVLLVGESGTAKTVTIQAYLHKLKQHSLQRSERDQRRGNAAAAAAVMARRNTANSSLNASAANVSAALSAAAAAAGGSGSAGYGRRVSAQSGSHVFARRSTMGKMGGMVGAGGHAHKDSGDKATAHGEVDDDDDDDEDDEDDDDDEDDVHLEEMLLEMNFSSRTTSLDVQRTMENHIEKRTNTVLGPPAKKRLVVFVDDVNMPKVDAYGTQQPIAFLKLLIDHHAWYDRKDLLFKAVRDTQFVAAMAPPGGGRHALDPRFVALFTTFHVPFPADDSIHTIYTQILSDAYARLGGSGSGSGGSDNPPTTANAAVALAPTLTGMTLRLYKDLVATLPATPAKFHYIFNLRDLSRVYEGLCRATHEKFADTASLLRLWRNEVTRVFVDRMSDPEDKAHVHTLVRRELERHFADDADVVLREPLLFGDFGEYQEGQLLLTTTTRRHDSAAGENNNNNSNSGGGNNNNKGGLLDMSPSDDKDDPDALRRVYADLGPGYGRARALVETIMADLNATSPTRRVDLVMFDMALEHLLRITRVLSLPRGHCLLVGVGGSGKQSLTRLAAVICQMGVFEIVLARNYTEEALREDLKRLYHRVGVARERVVFLFTDSHVKEEGFLELINNMLASGMVPALFSEEEKEPLYRSVADDVVARGLPPSKDNKWTAFVARCRDNLHVVLSMSPSGDTLRTRCRNFPSLINNTTIDWFEKWPAQALRAVGTKLLADEDVPDALREAIVQHMVYVHMTADELSLRYQSELKRHNYVTPKNFLGFLANYARVLLVKRESVDDLVRKFTIGLEKLQRAQDDVQVLQEELAEKEVTLREKQAINEQMTREITEQKSKNEARKEEALAMEEQLHVQNAEIETESAEAQVVLDQAMPALEEAMEAVKHINPKSITELRSFAKPPVNVVAVVRMVCVVKGVAPTWDAGKIMMGQSDFIRSLVDIDALTSTLNQAKINDVNRILREYPVNSSDLKKVSMAASGLMIWVEAMKQYWDVAKEVFPKQERVRQLQRAKETAERQLQACRDEIEQLTESLYRLEEQLRAGMREARQLQQEKAVMERRLGAARKLIDGFSSERVRWTEEKATLGASRERLVGDCLAGAAFVSYLGAFTFPYRQEALETMWLRDLRAKGVPVSEPFSVQHLLTDEVAISQWASNGLPSDALSVQNGILTSMSTDYTGKGKRAGKIRFPLCIDPQMQAVKWIKRQHADNPRFEVATFSDGDFLKRLEFAIQYGNPFLFESVDEFIDPIIDSVLDPQFKQEAAGQRLIRIGDKDVPWDSNFRLYLCTKLPNPNYPAEVFGKTMVINYGVTEDGLEAQLLNYVVASERSDLQRQSEELVRTMAESRAQLKELEDTLIRELTLSTGNILDNDDLIATLENTKSSATEVQQKLEQAKQTAYTTELSRQQYRPAAQRGAVLYFVLSQLSAVNAMYEYSLSAFLHDVFAYSITKSDASFDIQDRLHNIMDALTYNLYCYVCMGVFERDKLMLSFQIAIRLLTQVGRMPANELEFFLRGCVLASRTYPPRPVEWLTERQWNDVCKLASSVDVFAGLCESVKQHPDAWNAWFALDKPEEAAAALEVCGYCALPKDAQQQQQQQQQGGASDEVTKTQEEQEQEQEQAAAAAAAVDDGGSGSGRRVVALTDFQLLCLLRCFRADRVYGAVTNFIRDSDMLGERYVMPPILRYKDVLDKSSAASPIVCIVSPGANPTDEIVKLAGKEVGLDKLRAIALGQGQGEEAMKMVEVGAVRGHWVLLQNCHLLTRWMRDLEKTLEKMDQQALHEQFRLWLTTEPSVDFPMGILQRSLKVVNEPPNGLKMNMKNTLSRVTEEQLDACPHWAFRPLVWTLSFFHAVVQERRKYGKLGWNVVYDFNETDFTISMRLLDTYLSKAHASNDPSIPWDTLRYLVGEAMYGGRVTDSMDRRIVQTYLGEYLGDFLFDAFRPFHFFSDGEVDYCLPPGSADATRRLTLAQMLAHVDALPNTNTPDVFGLHPNAETGYLRNAAEGMWASLIELMPRSTGSVGEGASRESALLKFLDDVLAQVPAPFDQKRIAKDELARAQQAGHDAVQPTQVVLMQEVERWNALLATMVTSLKELQKALSGVIGMSSELDELASALSNGQLPSSWRRRAPATRKNLGRWLAHFQRRHAQYVRWSSEGEPPCVWLSGLMVPESYLSALVQVTCRKYKWPLDRSTMVTTVTSYMTPDEVQTRPRDGAYISGLYLEGARWDAATRQLAPQRKKQLTYAMPVMQVVPTESSRVKHVGSFRTPVYVTSERRNAAGVGLVFLADLASPAHTSIWTLESVALILDSDD